MRGGHTDLELYTMDADGTNQMLLNADSVQDVSPWWSPDGTLILYSPFGTGNDEIYTRNATDGSGLNNLSQSAGVDTRAVWAWATPANYRSIGTETADLHNTGAATASANSPTVTFSLKVAHATPISPDRRFKSPIKCPFCLLAPPTMNEEKLGIAVL